MTNKTYDGKVLTIVAGADITSGTGVQVNDLFGVALISAQSGANVTLELSGVFVLPKASGAVNQGAKVYWDDTAKNITTTSSGNKEAGRAWAAAQSGDVTMQVKLLW